MTKHHITLTVDSSSFFDVLHALGADEGFARIGGALSVPLLTGSMPPLLDAVTLGGYAITVESVKPVPLVEPTPDGYQQLVSGVWLDCSPFVAKGWEERIADGCRALYAEPPVDVYQALVDLAAWIEDECGAEVPHAHIETAVATAKRRLGL